MGSRSGAPGTPVRASLRKSARWDGAMRRQSARSSTRKWPRPERRAPATALAVALVEPAPAAAVLEERASVVIKASIAAVKVAPQVGGVSDASGNDITSYKDAGLNRIANLLEKEAPPGKGTSGLYVEIQNAAGKPVENSQAVVIAPNNVANLTTTIGPTAEAAARWVGAD